MSMIDLSYFKGEINIGQISSPDVQENVGTFITKYENDYIKKVFGDVEPIENDDLKEAIAHYVFYFYARNQNFMRAGVGAVRPKPENATIEFSLYQEVKAWNDMVDFTDSALKEIGNADLRNPFSYKNTLEI